MPYPWPVNRSVIAVLSGTFTLRFSTGLTGAVLIYYLADLPRYGGQTVGPLTVGVLAAAFFLAELLLAPLFGVISDRVGQRPVMQLGPLFGGVAVVLTGLTTHIPLLGATRLLEGSSTAASVPSILGYVARATAEDEPLRGRVVSRFELATLAGLGGGVIAAGPIYQLIGVRAFFLNAAIYGLSWAIFRFAVVELPPTGLPDPTSGSEAHVWRRYLDVLASSHVWILAPTWIAINAVLGIWSSQSIFQLVRRPGLILDEGEQLLMGGFTPTQVSGGLAVGLLVFFAGLLYWGGRFRRYRRTTILAYGVVGGAVAVVFALLLNHSVGQPGLLQAAYVLGGAAGLFVLAGATPAALGLLADISEAYPRDRGAIMGLYSVFLSLGQIAGSLIGGEAGRIEGFDGILVATLVLLGIALLPLYRLRALEHLVGSPGPAQPPSHESRLRNA